MMVEEIDAGPLYTYGRIQIPGVRSNDLVDNRVRPFPCLVQLFVSFYLSIESKFALLLVLSVVSEVYVGVRIKSSFSST
jgi:hypothetical protein